VSPSPPAVDAVRRPSPPSAVDDASDAVDASVGRTRLGSWRAWLGVLISAAFVAYAFRGQDAGAVWATLRRVELWWLPPALAFYFAGVWVRAFRWGVLLRPLVAVSARGVLPVVVAGYTANNVLPLRTGELVRAFLLGRRYGVRKTSALATIAVERLFDGLTMLAFVLAATTVISFTAELRQLTLVAFALFAAVLLGLFALTLGGTLRDRLLQLALGPLPTRLADRVERLAESFLGGLGVLTRRRDLALVAGSSLLAWGCEAAMYWTVARGFEPGLRDAMGPAAALLTTGVANLATLVPSAPGYVGPFEYGIRLALHDVLGVPAGLALSYAILLHAALWFPVTLWGAVEWWRQHLALSEVRRPEEGAGTPAPAVPPAPSTVGGADDVRNRRLARGTLTTPVREREPVAD
jgi:uncharacterized protein (TIRG00374 family)